MNARREIEISAHVSKEHGDSIAALNLLEQRQLTALTRSCYADREGMVLLLITKQPAKTRKILESAGYRCGTNPVLLVGPMPYRPGVAARLCTEFFNHGIKVLYTYLSSTDADHCFMVFSTSDNERAMRIAQHETEMIAA